MQFITTSKVTRRKNFQGFHNNLKGRKNLQLEIFVKEQENHQRRNLQQRKQKKGRKRSYNYRHSTTEITIGPTSPLQMECRNSMGSIMDTPFLASIPIISTNLASNDASNPSFSTHQVESWLDYDLLKEYGYEQGDHNQFSEMVPIIVDEVCQQTNNVV